MIVCVLTVVLYSQMFSNEERNETRKKKSNNNHTLTHTHIQTIRTFKVNKQYEMLFLYQYIVWLTGTDKYIFCNETTWFAWKMKKKKNNLKKERGKVSMVVFVATFVLNHHLMSPLPLIKHSKVHL